MSSVVHVVGTLSRRMCILCRTAMGRPRGSMSHQEQLGLRALKLLAQGSMVAILRGLADGALRPAELEHRLPDAGHSVVMRRLRHLLESQLATYERRPGLPPHGRNAGIPDEARYSLTDPGRML